MKKILISFQQVGGANALLPLFYRWKTKYEIIVTGKKLVCDNLKKNGVEARYFSELGWAVGEGYNKSKWFEELSPDMVITDTINLSRDPEGIACRELWELSNEFQVPSLAYVDCWWGYSKRFCLPQENVPPILPDVIAVVDELAKDAMVSKGFPNDRISVLGNPRFEMLASKLQIRDKKEIYDIKKEMGFMDNAFVLVFVSQPIEKAMGSAEIWGFTEKTTICAVIDVLKELPEQIKKKLMLVIVVHPEDDVRELRKIVEQHKPCFSFSLMDMKLSLDLIYIADLIVGMYSILLTEAVIMQRPVLSVQLNQKREEILVTNMVGATTAVRTKEQLITLLPKAIIEESYRKCMLDRQNKFKIVPDASGRWASKINYLIGMTGRQKLQAK